MQRLRQRPVVSHGGHSLVTYAYTDGVMGSLSIVSLDIHR
jgi:hypothetical protein